MSINITTSVNVKPGADRLSGVLKKRRKARQSAAGGGTALARRTEASQRQSSIST